jgi:hypothetical protein
MHMNGMRLRLIHLLIVFHSFLLDLEAYLQGSKFTIALNKTYTLVILN